MAPIFPWTRNWTVLRRGGQVAADGAREILSTDALLRSRCTVMLGLPGMGKTTEIQHLQRLALSEGASTDLVALGSLATSEQLEQVLDHSEGRERWLKGGAWAIHLDGLDEVVVDQESIIDGLVRSLRTTLSEARAADGNSLARSDALTLRISCRAASWQRSFEAELAELFGDSIDVVDLNPLDQSDAEDVAISSGVDDAEWRRALTALERAGADAFTRRPITLQIMLNVYRKTGELPQRHVALYRQGILALLEDGGRRLKNRLAPRLETRERFEVAARIAAATVFSNKTSVIITASAVADNDTAILADLSGGSEAVLGESFRVDEPDILEMLRTALFEPVGDASFRWSHRTFAEYLAAYYLAERGLSTQQLLEFLGSPGDKNAIPPPLHEVASWVASMRQDFFDALTARQPAILLRSDVAGTTDEARAHLTSQLLLEYDRGHLFDNDWSARHQYAKLAHPGLAEQLKPYISGKERGFVARRAAIQIAVQCREQALVDEMVSVALDAGNELYIRVPAASAVAKLGAPEQVSKLRPLVLPGDPADEDDELRGTTLNALWPTLIDFDDLLAALTPRKRDNFIGSYWSFRHDLKPRLSPGDAVKAVKWVEARALELDVRRDSSNEELLVNLLVAAWEQVDDERVVEAFADFASRAESAAFSSLVYTPRFAAFIENYSKGEASRRHRLATLVFRKLAEQGKSPRLSIYGRWPLLVPEDIGWLLGELASGASGVVEETVVDTIVSLLFSGGIADQDAVWNAAQDNDLLADALDKAFTTRLDDELARYQQESARERREREKEATFDLAGEAARRLARSDTHVEEWWTFNLLFFADEHGHSQGNEFAMDLAEQPLWSLLTPEQQKQAINWAERYLLSGIPTPRSWLGTSTLHRPAAAAYRAFRLLLAVEPSVVDAFAAGTWARWVPAILGISANEDGQEQVVRRGLVASAYKAAPRATLATLARLLLRASNDSEVRQVLERIEGALDNDILGLLWRLARRQKLVAAARIEIWSYLVAQDHPRARDMLTTELERGGSGEALGFNREQFLKVAATFLHQAPGNGWEYLGKLSDRALARDIFLTAHAQHSLGSFPLAPLSDAQLGDFYLWIEAEFPQPADEDEGGARWIGPEDQVQFTRRAVLDELVRRGTASSVEAIRKIVDALPDQAWLGIRLLDAEANYQTSAWRWDSPSNILRRIASYGTALPVRSAKQELEAAAAQLESGAPRADRSEEFQNPAPDIEPASPDDAPCLKILSVATEWSSAHGGLSTLNRELCIALAGEAHRVACLVLDATDDEKQDAASRDVTLITSEKDPGVEGTTRLFLASNKTLAGLDVDLVIGHDHITGPAAQHVARRVLDVPYVHFVHTIPDEIEAFKSDSIPHGMARGADKADVQFKQCKGADLVVGVGPRIAGNIGCSMNGTPEVIELRPGLNADLLSQTRSAGALKKVNILFQGRLEHAELKGAKLAFEATRLFRQDPEVETFDRPALLMRGVDRDKFDKQCKMLGDEQAVQAFVKPRYFTTDATELEADLLSASLMLMPSKTEGFGLAGLEAIAAGIPVLLSANSGIAEMLSRDPEIAVVGATIQDWIRDVEDTGSGIIEADWSEAIKAILSDRDAAFARADKLRRDLASILNWPLEARKLAVEFQKLRNAGQERTIANSEETP